MHISCLSIRIIKPVAYLLMRRLTFNECLHFALKSHLFTWLFSRLHQQLRSVTAPLNRFYVLWRHRNHRCIIIIINRLLLRLSSGFCSSHLLQAYEFLLAFHLLSTCCLLIDKNQTVQRSSADNLHETLTAEFIHDSSCKKSLPLCLSSTHHM